MQKKVRLVGGDVVTQFLQWGISDWDSSLQHFPVRGDRANKSLISPYACESLKGVMMPSVDSFVRQL